MKSFRLAIVIAVVISCLCRVSAAQNVYGSTTLDIDPDSGIVTATCETDFDGALDGNYQAEVMCTVTDQNGAQVAFGSAADVDQDLGYAQAVLTFSGTPGFTYTATGRHHAFAVVEVQQFLKTVYEDPFNFSNSFESVDGDNYPDYYDWFGPGPEQQTKTSSLNLGLTKDTGIRYYTPYELSQLITSAQSLFSSQCNTDFTNVVGSSYNNVNFFESLRATSFIQYPPGAPNIPSHGSADAATLINQSGRPIELFPNFYPTAAGFPAGFQEFILIHEGLHHYTGWLDFSDGSGTPDFVDMFYSSGYRNTSGTSDDFSVWISSSCPTAP